MHLRLASELFIDEPLRLPDILVGGGQPSDCALTAASGGRTVASLVTRHLAGALEARCRTALAPCLEAHEDEPRTALLRLERVGATGARAFRLTAWVDRLGDDGVTFFARADDGEGGGCEATISFVLAAPASPRAATTSLALEPPALAA